MKMTYKILPILALALYSCEPVDPSDPNEEELITTFSVDLVGPTSTATLSYVDMDGDGGSAPVISVDSLESNTVYTGSLTLLNESVSPAEDITTEVFDEADDHQFFFYSSGESTFTYSDQDNDGNPLGLEFELTTGSTGSELYTFILRHEPIKTAAGVSDGDITNAGGETDITVVFEIVVK
ncbi:type 1 periplasmic binding fold superfamily protein [Schleiferiaceae bacterium]|nr:type 1 periplasmic binding fold superfamily protein [Schleiferiaceae bacterium]MDC3217448.1 type 1 periplasmic binding fold superfamily protein [Schleiferiaceae bacterium]